MKKFKAVAFGTLVLVGLFFSSTEVQASEELDNLDKEKVSLERQISELETEVKSNFGNANIINGVVGDHPAAEKIRRINQLQKKLLDVTHQIKAINKVLTYNQRIVLCKASKEKGEEPTEQDGGTWNNRIDYDNKLLKAKHDFIEMPGLPLTPSLYGVFKLHSKYWALENIQIATNTAARRMANEHVALVAALNNARTYLQNAADIVADDYTTRNAFIAAKNYDALTLLDNIYECARDGATALKNVPDTYPALRCRPQRRCHCPLQSRRYLR
ncbi:hypothetical protein AGMMS49593_07930 [Endomicrobiia bacterium]|nr:hypothetical protein AGMMS49593_07930 [Endomicrobiia bacterium]